MEPNAEEDRYSDDEEERKKYQRPPSSYGSMKSDSDDGKEDRAVPETDEDGLDEIQCDQEVAGVFIPPGPVEGAAYEGAGVQMNRAASPETLYSRTTMQTKPPGAMIIDTRASDIERASDVEEEDEEEDILITNSPEPPEPIELEDEIQMDAHGQPGRLHPEQDLAHVFKNIQKTLTDLGKEDLYKFKLNFNLRLSSNISLQQMFEGDLLDFVDRIIEMFGLELSLSSTIATLENITKHKEAEELRVKCKKALIRYSLKQEIVRNSEFVFEGIPRPGKRSRVDDVYIEPEIYVCTCGGVDTFHEFRNPHQTPSQSPHPDSVVSLNNMFRRQRSNGQPVRTVVTSGIAGVGLSMTVAKYCHDWAQHRANKDLQYVITLPFSSLWILRKKDSPMSIMDVIEYHHSLCKTKTYLDDKECKFLILMDSFDCYQTLLDWTNTPIMSDNHTPAKLDDLIVNLIRGYLLPNAQVWILGRRAAVSRIPREFVDVFTEIHGFNNEMRDYYVRRRFASPELGASIVHRYKQLPMLRTLTQQPLVCWMVSELFSYSFKREENYGIDPPKLTPFYVNVVVIQTNRKLQFYYEKPESNNKWNDVVRRQLSNLGCMALKMLERNTTEFSEEYVTAHGLDVMDVTVFSGLCTELPTVSRSQVSPGKRRFCFIHTTFQEFMAALYVFNLFRMESKNALEQRGILPMTTLLQSHPQAKSSVDIVQSALNLTFNTPLGQYDMFLRFLCGLLSPDNNKQLGGNLYSRNHNADMALFCPEVKDLLRRTIQTCPAERRENIEECYRELTQTMN